MEGKNLQKILDYIYNPDNNAVLETFDPFEYFRMRTSLDLYSSYTIDHPFDPKNFYSENLELYINSNGELELHYYPPTIKDMIINSSNYQDTTNEPVITITGKY